MVEVQLAVYLLLFVNVAAYLALAAQLFRSRRRKLPGAATLQESFVVLADALKAAVPNLPPGFTWSEGLENARRLGLQVDWGSVRRALERYEDYRYGGKTIGDTDYTEVVKLSIELEARAAWKR